MTARAAIFRYLDLEVTDTTLMGHYELDGRHFHERITFSTTGPLTAPAPRALADLWFLLAGLSYYKAGAATTIDLGTTPISQAGRALLRAAVTDGLGEFAYRNALDLTDVDIIGGVRTSPVEVSLDETSVLTPFGGGIDSIVTVMNLNENITQKLFVMSPPSGLFEPLEAAAAITQKSIVRATRSLDPQILTTDPDVFNGHVPVTAMVTLLAAIAAVADGSGGVVMSNEHSASVPNLSVAGREVNHQWSKSLVAEELIAVAVAERIGSQFTVASFLRDRSELWVARAFSELRQYHAVFRSCNRAFAQDPARRSATWCANCDKCLFIALILAPFMTRAELAGIFDAEPLAHPDLTSQLTALVGQGSQRKPFECVGDPDECSVALQAVAESDEWKNVLFLAALARRAPSSSTLPQQLEPQGVSRAPAAWFR